MLSQLVRPSAARSVASSYLVRCQSSTAVAAARRYVSSSSSNNNNNNSGVLRSSPAYNVFGEKNMLSVKVIMPEWKLLKNGTLVLDQGKKGRILLEWSPRAPGGGLQRDRQVRFGLSPEEVGFMLHQLPENAVEFVRTTPSDTAEPLPEKVFKVTPGEAGQFSFAVDFEKAGVGGQVVGTADAALGPLEVVVQLGEYQVIRELMQSSIPALTGWSTQMSLAMSHSVHLAMQSGGGGPASAKASPAAADSVSSY